MSQHGILSAIPLSFYSKDLYRDVAWNWGAKVFWYLLILLMILWIPFTILMQSVINVAYQQHADSIVQQVPEITIRNGILSTPENHPYFVKLKGQDENFAVIDTSGQYKNLQDAKSTMLITSNEVITQSKPNEIRSDKIPDDLNMVVKPVTVKDTLSKFVKFLWIPIYLGVVFFGFIGRVIQVLFYAILGKLFSLVTRVSLTYFQIVQITTIAITPALIIRTILEVFSVFIPNIFYFLISLAYIFYGVYVNKASLPISVDNEQLNNRK